MSGSYMLRDPKIAYRAKVMVVVQHRGAEGGEMYVNPGRMIPSGADSAHVQHLLDLGLIEAVER